MKKIISMLITVFLILSVNITTFASDTIYVTLDGSYIEFDVKPQIINGRTMVPIRAIFEKMGATVEWDNSNRSANITYDLTSGEPVEFVDKGIEHLCRIAITLGDIDTTDANNLNDETTVAIGSNTLKLYEGVIYNSTLKNITTLGVRKGYTFPVIVNSIEDISKFPNIENLYLEVREINLL